MKQEHAQHMYLYYEHLLQQAAPGEHNDIFYGMLNFLEYMNFVEGIKKGDRSYENAVIAELQQKVKREHGQLRNSAQRV